MVTDLPLGVTYEPGTLLCWNRYAADHITASGTTQIPGTCPAWSITGEDGTTLTVFREGQEVNGYATDPDGTRRVAYGSRPRGQEPLARFPHLQRIPCHPHEVAAMNRILVPIATERTWEDLVAECAPCDHTDCVATRRAS